MMIRADNNGAQVVCSEGAKINDHQVGCRCVVAVAVADVHFLRVDGCGGGVGGNKWSQEIPFQKATNR